jgi:hypothetical protein
MRLKNMKCIMQPDEQFWHASCLWGILAGVKHKQIIIPQWRFFNDHSTPASQQGMQPAGRLLCSHQ